MKLSVNSNYQQDLNNLFIAIEKVGKVVKLNIDNGDKITVLDDLDWFEENFYSLLALQNKNSEKFYSIIDPNANLHQKNNFSSNNDKLYNSNYYDHKEEHIVEKYLEVLYSISKISSDNKLDDISKKSQLIIGNWLKKIILLEDKKLNTLEFLKLYLKKCLSYNQKLLVDYKTKSPFINYAYYLICLDSIFNIPEKISHLNILFDYLFNNIKLSIDKNADNIYKPFIERCIDGGYLFLSNYPYHQLNSYLIKSSLNTSLKYTLGSEIDKLIFLTTNSISFENSERVRENIEELNKKFTFYKIIDKVIIETIFRDIYLAWIKQVKYNALRDVLIKLSIYSIYKNNFIFIRYLFNYNHPVESISRSPKQDILPLSLRDILKTLLRKNEFCYSLEQNWEGHYEVDPFFNKFITELLKNNLSISNRNSLNADIESSYVFFKNLNNEQLTLLSSYLKQIPPHKSIVYIQEILLKTITDLQKESLKSPLDTKIFFEDIFKEYKNGKNLSLLLTENLDLNKISVANVFLSGNVSNDIIAYNGVRKDYITYLANKLISQENNIIFNTYTSNAIEAINTFESEANNLFNDKDLSDKVIIARNVNIHDILNIENYISPYKNLENPYSIFPAGSFNNALIYNIKDNGPRTLFVLDKKQLGTIQYTIPDNHENLNKLNNYLWYAQSIEKGHLSYNLAIGIEILLPEKFNCVVYNII